MFVYNLQKRNQKPINTKPKAVYGEKNGKPYFKEETTKDCR